PESRIPEKGSREAVRTNELIEFLDDKKQPTDGFFRNTTIGGPVTGESLDIGVIDDPFKGRAEANSPTIRDKVWDWFTDDFGTRFDDKAGLLIIMTRWHVDDLVGRLVKERPETVVLNYPALATKDEEHRKIGTPLFPELKSKEFLLGKKSIMTEANWSALYQGMPVVVGGDMVKDSWWRWWTRLPKLAYKFIVIDTAQKVKIKNDFTDFQCWGMGVDDNIYLLDHIHEKFEAPALRREAYAFYNKHNTKRVNVDDPVLRAMYIEDKSSGTGLIQELRLKGVKVVAVQRNTDKVFRCEDASPEIEAGRVYLNEDVKNVSVITQEGREFPNGEFDDAFDNTMNAIEVAYLTREASNSLQAAMEAD
ncbi:MAG: phage terminase large subunit, partial [Desulfobacteraceae bacterium]|nr:phage terminase large subunit [Desulfobacteraceae bacterium]